MTSWSAKFSLARSVRSVEKPLRLGIAVLLTIFLWNGPMAIADEKDAPVIQLIQEKKWAEAALLLKARLREAPDEFQAALHLSRALTHLGRREEAAVVLRRFVRTGKPQVRTLAMRRLKVLSRLFITHQTFQSYQEGVDLIRAGKYIKARKRLGDVLSKEPSNVEVLVRLAQCEMMTKSYDAASEHLRKAGRINPYEPEIQLWLGRAFFQRGEIGQAIRELESAYKKLERSELAPIWLADAYLALENRERAKQLLRSDVEREPFHLLSLVRLARLELQERTKSSKRSALQYVQLAMSRLGDYRKLNPLTQFETDLGLTPHQAKQVEADIDLLFRTVTSGQEEKEGV